MINAGNCGYCYEGDPLVEDKCNPTMRRDCT